MAANSRKRTEGIGVHTHTVILLSSFVKRVGPGCSVRRASGSCQFPIVLLCFETEPCCVIQMGLELTMDPRLPWDLQGFCCVSLCSPGMTAHAPRAFWTFSWGSLFCLPFVFSLYLFSFLFFPLLFVSFFFVCLSVCLSVFLGLVCSSGWL